MTEEEVGRLPKVIIERFPEHLPESVASLGKGEMRVSEHYTLTWKHVDFERREFIFDGTKNGSPRRIEMHSALMEALEEPQEICANPGPSGCVFHINNPGK